MQSLKHLNETRKWTMLLSVIGFVFIGLIVILAFTIGPLMNMSGHETPFPGFLFTIIYLLMAALYFFPVLYLFRFSNHIKTVVKTPSSDDLLSAFKNLKSHYKFIGIMVIVMLVVYLLVFIAGIVGGAMMFNNLY